jgi:transcriptional regulator with XRE-family HTH domain
MKSNRDTFGARLKVEREQRGISLSAIARSTKIKESQFAELERGDDSKWPQGIFRRAHLCAYLSAIGLPSQPWLTEFMQLFPAEPLVGETDQINSVEAPQAAQTTQAVTPPPSSLPPFGDRLWILAFDVAAVCCLASAGAAVIGLGLAVAVALAALGYFAVGIACFDQSIGAHIQERVRGTVEGRPRQPVKAPVREVRLIVSQRDRSRASARDLGRQSEVQDQRVSA